MSAFSLSLSLSLSPALEEHPAIPVMGFLSKLSIMQTNDNQLFLEEFGSIDMAPQFSTDVANLPLNRAKNRYNNILPYDHSRVKLSSHKHSTDYINASYCAVSHNDIHVHACTCTCRVKIDCKGKTLWPYCDSVLIFEAVFS